MSQVERFLKLLNVSGSDVVYHKDESTVPCPCLTPEGYRDPVWHLEHSEEPECNEVGFLPGATTHVLVKAFVQPAMGGRFSRITDEYLARLFGEVQVNDHIGIFPVIWLNTRLAFEHWSQAGEDYIEYHGMRFVVVNSSLVPDPSDGNPEHHWECGLRLVTDAPL